MPSSFDGVRMGAAKVSVVLTADDHGRDERRAGEEIAVTVQLERLPRTLGIGDRPVRVIVRDPVSQLHDAEEPQNRLLRG